MDAVLGSILPDHLQPAKTVQETLKTKKSLETYTTIVEAVTQLPSGAEAISEAFDRSIEAINRLILSYAFVRRDPTVARVTREQLDPYVFVLRRPAEGPPVSRPSLFMTGGLNVQFGKDLIEDDRLPLVGNYLSLLARGHPLVGSSLFILERSRADWRVITPRLSSGHPSHKRCSSTPT